MTSRPVEEHGGHGAALALQLGCHPASILDLSATLNPLAPDVVGLVQRFAPEVRRYPDPTAATRSLAAAIDVDPARVVLTNGGAEAIALTASILPHGRVDEPEFSLYRRHLTTFHPDAPRWRSNPNNPTGVLAAADDAAVVWDEAFYPLTTGRWSRGDDTSWRLGSLTKVWACPGLRLGYLIAPNGRDADLARHRQAAWSVNSLALAVVPALLDETDLEGWAVRIRGLKADLATVLRAAGLRVEVPDAPWVLVGDDHGVRDRLAGRGIATRDCTSFGLAGTLRIAVPDAAGIERVAAALEGSPT
jgi:histidinol-phosphate/aromatic aminotransferase/cobyric acid decarboxylase-like protein